MTTTCIFNADKQEFGGSAQFISVGGISENASVSNSTVEGALVSDTIYASQLNKTTQQFRVTLAGTISSDGTDDVTLTLRYGSTDILALTTVSLPDEDDKAFKLVFEGRVHTTGASGKVVAYGHFETGMTGIANIVGSTAVAGVSVDLTAAGSLNVTADWDGASADTDVIVHTGFVEYFN